MLRAAWGVLPSEDCTRSHHSTGYSDPCSLQQEKTLESSRAFFGYYIVSWVFTSRGQVKDSEILAGHPLSKAARTLPVIPPKSAIHPLVLCVEDNETHLRLRKAVLEKAGYSVLGATKGVEAMAMLRDAPVCLVISDHMLAGTTGTALARDLKKIKRDVPVIVHSGNVPESMEYVDGFINKDESVSSFLALVHGFVKRYCE